MTSGAETSKEDTKYNEIYDKITRASNTEQYARANKLVSFTLGSKAVSKHEFLLLHEGRMTKSSYN